MSVEQAQSVREHEGPKGASDAAADSGTDIRSDAEKKFDQDFLELVEGYGQERWLESEPLHSQMADLAVSRSEAATSSPDPEGTQHEQPEEERSRRLWQVSKPTKPLYTPAEQRADKKGDYVRIQDWVSKPFALSTQLSLDTLSTSPDYYSTYNIAPQPDGGRGMVAMAKAYVGREQKHTPTAEKTVIWAYSHNGLDLRDFLCSVQEQDQAVAGRTRAMLVCDSQDRLDTIRDSGLFKGLDVKFDLIDPQDPHTFDLPPNTGVALLPDTLDKLPAHQVLVGQEKKQVLELLETTMADRSRPLVLMDRRTGQARLSPAEVLRAHETTEGITDRYEILPQLFGRLRRPQGEMYELQHTELRTREESTTAFLDSVPERLRNHGSVFNYAADVEDIVATVTANIREDGLVYISAPLRDRKWLSEDDLTSVQGPVISHVVEAASIRNGVAAADARLNAGRNETDPKLESSIRTVTGDAGSYSYVLIDRAQAADEVDHTFDTFQSDTITKEAESALQNLTDARQTLAEAIKAETIQPEQAQAVLAAYRALKEHYPQAGRDAFLPLDLARACVAAKQYGPALALAEEAHEAAPYFSGALVENARAQAGLGQHTAAIKKLIEAYGLSPRNPVIHENIKHIYDSDTALKKDNLTKYVEAASDYLRFGQGLSNQDVIDTLQAITEALEQDWEAHEHDETAYKTVLVQDLETETISERRLSVNDIKRIKAAEAAEANAAVAGTLRHYESATNEVILRAQSRLLDIWRKVVPKRQDQPLPRDLWGDRPGSRTERWLYSGRLDQGDTVVAKPDASKIRSYMGSLASLVKYESPLTSEEDEPPAYSEVTMTLGKKLNARGQPVGHPFEMPKDALAGHVFITGRTGMGKTTLMETMFEQLPSMETNFWAFDLGDKSELHTIADRLKAKGIPVVVLTPGAEKESDGTPIVPFSIDILNPVEGTSVDEHIGKFVDIWITAYGGGGDSPVGPILSRGLRDVYVANGWPVTPIEGEVFPEVGQGKPTVPSLSELLDACVKRASEYNKSSNAGQLPIYFKKRIEALEAGALGSFLVGENGVDWEQLSNANVIFDFSHITSHDQRRLAFTAFTQQAASYLRFRNGLTDDVKMVWAMDEASLITKDVGEGEMSRKQGVEAFTSLLRVLRGNGVSVWSADQSTEGVDPLFLSQNSATISLALKAARDKHAVLTSLGLEEGSPTYRRLFAKMTSAKRGTALVWFTGMKEPVLIKVDRATRPSKAALASAQQQRLPAPIKPNPYSRFTISQHNEAIRQAQTPEQAWKQLFIGAVVLAHVAQIDLPEVPAELKEQWDIDTEKDGEFARLLLYHIVKQAVNDRIPAIRTAYPPAELRTSVMANALGLLNGEANAKRVSPAFGLLPVRESRTHRRLTNPTYGKPPGSEQFAEAFEHDLPRPVKPVRKEVQRRGVRKTPDYPTTTDQVAELRRHHASPANAGPKHLAAETTDTAFFGLLGRTKGGRLWQSIRTATDGEIDKPTQRRLVAAALGYLTTCFSPEESEFEELLALSYDLHERSKELAAAA